MLQQLLHRLSPVRSRHRLLAALDGLIIGIVAGSALVIVLEMARRLGGGWESAALSVIVMLAVPLIGAVIGFVWPQRWARAAEAVDHCYSLKDRTATALQFAAAPAGDGSALRELAIADAQQHLDTIDARRVAPLRMPRRWQPAAVMLLLAMMLLLWPSAERTDAALKVPLAPLVHEAEHLQEEFRKLEEMAKELDAPELEELAEKLNEQAEQMKQPGVDLKEALAKLSLMQAEMLKQRAQYNLAAVDEHLQSLAAAFSEVAATDSLGKALSKADFEQAAKLMEQIAPPADQQQRKQLEKKLMEMAEAMQAAGLSGLGGATGDLGDAVGSGDGAATTSAGHSMASQLRRHAQRKKIDSWLMQQLARLNECKSNCAACDKEGLCKACKGGGCSSCNGTGKNGGAGTGRSDSPGTNWGTGASGNEMQDPTQLGGTRDRKEITGTAGDGPSEIETLTSPEGRQEAGRGYREVYNEYRKLSDAVLENEAIPLGHRQTIRRYFESIRPADAAQEPSPTQP